MSILTKNQLSASNQSSFPDNTTGAITPEILRNYNQGVIDTLVDSLNTGSFAITTGSNDFTQANSFTSISASSWISASKFYGDGSSITGITASVALPILDEGILQGYATALNFSGSNISASLNAGVATISVNTNNLVTTSSFNQLTASVNQFTSSINQFTSSQETKDSTLANVTASLNAYTSSNNTKWSNLGTQSGSWVTESESGSFLITASVNLNTLTFTKGDNTTFAVTVNTGSAQTTDITSLNAFTASQNTKNSTLATYTASVDQKFSNIGSQSGSWITESETGSFAVTNATNAFTIQQNFTSISASAEIKGTYFQGATAYVDNIQSKNASSDITMFLPAAYKFAVSSSISVTGAVTASFFKGDGSGLTNLPGQVPLTSLNSATASLFASASLALVTASFDNGTRNLTFTKGDTTQFSVNIPDVSGSGVPTGTVSGSAQIVGLGFLQTSSFNAYTQSNDTKWNTLGGQTGSYITNAQTSSMSVATASVALAVSTSISTQNLQHFVTFTDSSTGTQAIYLDGGLKYNPNQDLLLVNNITSSGYISASSLNLSGTLTASLQTGYILVGNANNITTLVSTSSFLDAVPLTSLNTYTASNDTKWNTLQTTTASFSASVASISALTGSYATTGSNVFIGNQTLQDGASNTSTLVPASGSLMLVAKTFTSASAHFTASASNQTNLIFKFDNSTADTIISGSGNIFSNQSAAVAGFKRYIGGNNNNFVGVASVPSITGSMGFSPSMNANYLAGTVTMRGPVSSSAWSINQNNILGTLNIGAAEPNSATKLTSGLSFTGNYIAGTVTLIANQSALTGSTTTLANNNINGVVSLQLSSSAITFSGNTINDGAFTFNNNYYTSSAGTGLVTAQRNTIAGNTNTITLQGAQQSGVTTQPQLNDNLIAGANNTIFADVSTTRISGINNYSNFYKSIVAGYQLIVSASSAASDLTSHGSAFFGRFAADDGRRNKSSDTVFSVGTGTTTSARKTGFLIDSGSNTFIEGTLNISGSTTMTGSLILSSSNATELFVIGNAEFTGSVYGNVVSMSISSNTASMDLSAGNYFELTASVSPLNINVTNLKGGVTSTLSLSGSTAATITFSPNVLQPSGSLYTASVSGQTDILSFVAFNSSKVNVVSTLKMV